MRPAFDVTDTQSRTSVLSDRDRNAAGVFLRTIGISTIFTKGHAAFDRVQIKSDEFVGHDLRVRNLATADAEQLTGVNLEAAFRLPLPLGNCAEHADPPIAPDVIVARTEVGT